LLPKGPPALGTKGQEIDTLTGRLLRVIPGTAYHFNSHDGLAVADPFVADAGSITESDASMGALAHVISARGNGARTKWRRRGSRYLGTDGRQGPSERK
jgi:hypothetical protein